MEWYPSGMRADYPMGLANFLILSSCCLFVGACRVADSHRAIGMDPADSADVLDLLHTNRIHLSPDSFAARIGKNSSGQVEILDFRGLDLDSFSIPFSAPVLPACIRLDLSYGGIRGLGGDFSTLPAVRKLVLDDNSLSTLPPSIGRMSGLRVLAVSHNLLNGIPNGFFPAMSLLYHLDLSFNAFTEFPLAVSELDSLDYLNLWGNRIGVLDTGFCSLKARGTLLLRDNPITSIPDCDFSLWESHALAFSGNRLIAVPEGIFQAKNLEYLDLSGNSIAALPGTVGGAASLRTLNLADNELTSLPREVTSLGSLYKNSDYGGLDIDGNRLCDERDSVKAWVETFVKNSGKNGAWEKTQRCK